MSQASKHVKWCIDKANKEISECEKLGKRKKHRGLLELEPDIKNAKLHLRKAEHNLKAVILLEKEGFSDWSITAGFYTFYHCFLAIASKFGYESGNQSCTISLIEYLVEQGKIDIDKKYVDMLKYADSEDKKEESVIDMREEFTYGIKISPDNGSQIRGLVDDCQNIIEITKEIIFQ